MPANALEIAFWIAATAGWLWAIVDLHYALSLERLPTAGDLDIARCPSPTVTVIVPARDEALRIEGTVRRLLAQKRIEIEIVVVDDRSTDGTSSIVERLAREDARVRLVRVDALPQGWLGKCHALQRGGEAARGDWILFTDGDAWIGEDVIARAVAVAHREHVDHIVIAPHEIGATLLGQAGLSVFSVELTRYMARASRNARGGHVGIGAFNLVRAASWRAIGGHTKLAYEVVDDLKLGLLLVRAGFRTMAYVGPDTVHVEWSRTLFGVVKALEKNLFAALRYDTRIVVALVLLVTLGYALAITGAVVGGVAGWMACSAVLARALPAVVIARKHGASTLPAILSPCVAPIMVLAAVNSAWTTLRAGGVRWRETFYPLADLRRGRVR